ncbi:hypothetical protein CFIMG_003116RAa [Ceratocystis fimbriata CBS 114723]|uniref:G-protein coupled receptors family 2 profile 2 domain-containing protein n=1 Tax=Ceratocystis fimbriata CBS 114723 TaxID=1035309 RepID=A0A2C5X099_9PEZI|nr:hypothetical protein CFIMG_003116RAa [Ceratocystis fimbriata CBS 114723]
MAVVRPERLSESQLNSLSTIERTCSSLSLMGCIITILTFTFSPKFRKPINRIMFYATFGNMTTNIGTLMARAYIGSPSSGPCQFQGFLIQMFMPADAYWTLAMAVNVHLTFYNHFDDRKLRSMEIPYILLCYGIPFIPALTLLFIRNDGDLPYGDATLWCWLTPDWDLYRIVLFYAPVWFATVITIAIYIRAGRKILRIRKQLRSFKDTVKSKSASLKTTEIAVTSVCSANLHDSLPPGFAIEDVEEIHNTLSAYSITIDATEVPSSVQTVPLEPGNHTPAVVVAADPNPGNLHHLMPHVIRHWPRRHSRATTSERLHAHDANKAAWSYAKCAILFFAAMLITWIPSSANRVYSFIHKNRTSAPLEFMSAFVLPLQGFWNFFIYAVFSWRAFKELWEDFKSSSRFFTGGGTERVQLWKGVSIHPVDIRGGHADSATELATHGAS